MDVFLLSRTSGMITAAEAAKRIAAAGCSDQVVACLGTELNPVNRGGDCLLPVAELNAFISRYGKKSDGKIAFEAALDKVLGLNKNT